MRLQKRQFLRSGTAQNNGAHFQLQIARGLSETHARGQNLSLAKARCQNKGPPTDGSQLLSLNCLRNANAHRHAHGGEPQDSTPAASAHKHRGGTKKKLPRPPCAIGLMRMNGSRASGATMCDRGVTFCESLDVCAGSHGWDSGKASRLGRPRCVIGVSLSEGSPTEETDFVKTVHAKPQQKKGLRSAGHRFAEAICSF